VVRSDVGEGDLVSVRARALLLRAEDPQTAQAESPAATPPSGSSTRRTSSRTTIRACVASEESYTRHRDTEKKRTRGKNQRKAKRSPVCVWPLLSFSVFYSLCLCCSVVWLVTLSPHVRSRYSSTLKVPGRGFHQVHEGSTSRLAALGGR